MRLVNRLYYAIRLEALELLHNAVPQSQGDTAKGLDDKHHLVIQLRLVCK